MSSGIPSGGDALISITTDGGEGGIGGLLAYRGHNGGPGDGGDGGAIAGFTQDAGATVTNTGTGAAILLSTRGGTGNFGGQANAISDTAYGPNGGAGGNAGATTATLGGAITSNGVGLHTLSLGGNAGDGADATGGSSAYGGKGGQGGNGGVVSLTLADSATITALGATAEGSGGQVVVGKDSQGNDIYGTFSTASAALFAQSVGGQGGQGGMGDGNLGGSGGDGGRAGDGGAVTITDNGAALKATGYSSSGIVAQSIGGAAGAGNTAGGLFYARGGTGGDGGNGNIVTVTLAENSQASSMVRTSGVYADGVVAQSIGGGGGSGGSVKVGGVGVTLAVGGLGGDGGTASAVSVSNGVRGEPTNAPPVAEVEGTTISTHGDNSAGILAQSISGGGGRGGDAYALGFALENLSVGAQGGSGGTSGTVDVKNNGVIWARGAYAYGIAAQSIAGGGGMGGAAKSVGVDIGYAANIALGGAGGVGGNAGMVAVENSGTIVTGGDHSYGVLAQSIAGGGGAGGSSDTHGFSASIPDVPTLKFDVSLGGSGNNGGAAKEVSVVNYTGVLTTGSNAHGILAQSISGGGGAGGNAAGYETEVTSPSVQVSHTVGGGGGDGGSTGPVNIVNLGLIATLGDASNGILAQSITGGGGAGGSTNSDISYYKDGDYSVFNLNLNVGGSAGQASDCDDTSCVGSVGASNFGGIWTRGDKSAGILAQGIGGGGGDGGNAKADGSGTKFAVDVALGGKGGSGAVGGDVSVGNEGAILTEGGSAPAIHAQSIGGGGGTGGTGAVGSGSTPETNAFDYVAGGLGGNAEAIQKVDGVYGLKSSFYGDIGVFDKLEKLALDYEAGNPKTPTPEATDPDLSFTITLGAGRSGNGGIGGHGGNVSVVNSGTLTTNGPFSSGILAQSIGGGGGVGGAAKASTVSSNWSRDISGSAVIGGANGANGNGGEVHVNQTGTINTTGDLGIGIFAQSIGGGGGIGTMTIHPGGRAVDSNGNPSSLMIDLGTGHFNTNNTNPPANDGGDVTILVSAKDSTQLIQTTGRDAVGVVAQSIGSGGGATFVMSGTGDTGSKTGVLNPNVKFGVSLNAGADSEQNIFGNGGTVTLQLGTNGAGLIATYGVDAHGVLAQSIGGGGGWVAGATMLDAPFPTLFSSQGWAHGYGGTIDVNLSNAFQVVTYGAGAAGIVAQSIGGGGGLFGSLGNAEMDTFMEVADSGGNGLQSHYRGQGGNIDVSLSNWSVVATKGDAAIGLLAQSLGGGGGYISTGVQVDGGGTAGSAFGAAQHFAGCGGNTGVTCTGTVKIDVSADGSGGTIETEGANSKAILAQSTGNGTNEIDVHVGHNGYVLAYAPNSDAMALSAATINLTVDAGGYVVTSGSRASGDSSKAVNIAQNQTFNITNAGVIANGTYKGNVNGQAVTPNGFAIFVIKGTSGTIDNKAGGLIAGDVVSIADAISFTNDSGATYMPYNITYLPAGTFINNGTIDETKGSGSYSIVAKTYVNNGTIIKGSGSSGVSSADAGLAAADVQRRDETTIQGDFIQGPTGRIVLGVDHVAGTAGHVSVTGTATVDGMIEVNPTRINKSEIEVLTADGGLTLAGGLRGSTSAAISYATRQVGNALHIQPQADFTAGGSMNGGNRQAIAAHLQEIWDGGGDLGTGFADLFKVKDLAGYARTLDTISGQSIAAIHAARFASTRAFVSNLYSCPAFVGDSMLTEEKDCAWARYAHNSVRQDSNADGLGYRNTADVFQMGGQKQIGDHWFVGVSGAYESSRFQGLNNSATINGDTLIAGAVLKYQTTRWLVSGVLEGGYGWYDASRPVDIGDLHLVATAKPHSQHLGLHGRVAYQLPFERFYVKPVAEIHAVYLHGDSYVEDGADAFNLQVEDKGDVTVSGSAMVELGTRAGIGSSQLRLFAAGGVGFLGDGKWSATAHLTGAGMDTAGFQAVMPQPDTVVKVQAGAELLTTGPLTVKVQYSGDFGTGYQAHNGLLRLGYWF